MRSSHVRERALHHIWSRQYLRPEALRTTDGIFVRVTSAGRLSIDAGPDLRDARIDIGGIMFAGDVEIHRTAPEWYLHGHHTDPRYNGVILHVVLVPPADAVQTLTASGRRVPMLALRDVLTHPLRQVRLDALLDEQASTEGHLHCTGQNDGVPAAVLSGLLERLAVERFEVKLRRFEDRLHELARAPRGGVREPSFSDAPGDPDDIPPPWSDVPRQELARREVWDQLLYEGLMEGLGYSRNRRPFMRLSAILPLEVFRSLTADAVRTEALLFGAAGLLPRPSTVPDLEGRTYVHLLRQEWDDVSSAVPFGRLSPSDWVTAPLRPSNAPVVRLVAARSLVHSILHRDLFRETLRSLRQPPDGRSLRHRLHRLLSVEPGPFWEHRVNFARTAPNPVRPLGQSRTDDLIINTLFPLGLLYARTFREPALREGVLRSLAAYPAAAENAITRRMERQLLRGRSAMDSAVRQQGAIQLFQYYCREARCEECDVGRMVWGYGRPGV